MSKILQGTTPSLSILIDTDDFLVANVTALEFTILHDGTKTIYSLSDVTVDSENNSFTYTFSESETLAMNPSKPVRYQLRFKFEDGTIIGTGIMSLQVADLISEETMS